VVERTPNPVPYQNGKLYSYMLITLIPRFVWPEKPSFNEANQFFQVAYGLTRLRDLGNSSIAVGVLAESFINFGWIGVIVIMFLMGIFISVFQSIFFMPKTPMVLAAIGVVLLPSMLAIESQLVQYFGGMIQQVVVAYCVMLPITAIRRKTTTNRRLQGEEVAVPSR
jgi:oligosaccharide repeat unit polymerase